MKNQEILFENARIFLLDRVIDQGWILVNENGTIEEIGEGSPENLNCDVIVDVKGNCIIPGFIDVHMHGGNGYSFMDGSYESLAEISSFHAKHGTTSFLATTSTASKENIIKALNCASESYKKGMPGADLVGVHLEGPFINEKRSGAQEKSDIRLPSIEEIDQFLQASNNLIKLVTLAPEVENGFEAVKYFNDQGVTVSIGHSDANFQEVLESIKCGATHTTHHFNGMSPLHHREPGVAGAGMALKELTTEIIADGIHVHPEMVKLLFDVKGVWNTCAITDAVFCAGLPDGEYERVFVTKGQVYLSDGSTLAGSTLTMIQSLKNVISFTGYSLFDVLPSYTLVPARQAKIDHLKGSIEKGKDADFLIVDDEISILSTYVKGIEVYRQS
ncbi:N-acetylglucosamine-6-phosphate deacetylase [Bacillus sp. FJAT-49732]|uniref:N-acetylglucosamine-6-phosphate deacetylase n=1 Tax=Lederbergia citrisecunda TaxID=2833583 RepID=A0A942YID0_9BACI|nr:N-acetylglucosamine-6-phosphate deacetylase [Lederbergia citrisecunda]MBS4198198.1 N-acetylglucosamine-6-phosphate deacetylase [Lederbergia citrisecunda]